MANVRLLYHSDNLMVRVYERLAPSGEFKHWAILDYRTERQSLPRGSTPLMAFGGRTIEGQHFTAQQVGEYIALHRLNPAEVCVFETEHIR